MIVYGIIDTAQLTELIVLGQQFKISNFDIARMKNEGIITLVFIIHDEAIEFKKLLEDTKNYKVDYTLVREQLYEIPETDENQYGNQNNTGDDKI